jgi:hypothetical protein
MILGANVTAIEGRWLGIAAAAQLFNRTTSVHVLHPFPQPNVKENTGLRGNWT